MLIAPNSAMKPFIASMESTEIPGTTLQSEITAIGGNLYEVRISGTVEKDTHVGSWQLRILPAFEPDFYYTPHLTPEDDNVIDMHVFRTPAMMMGKGERVLCIIPNMDGVKNSANRVFLDLDAQKNVMSLGVTTTELCEHVLYRRTDKAVLPAGEFSFAFRIMLLEGEQAKKNPFRYVLDYYWKQYGEEQSKVLPPYEALKKYVQHTYNWAFGNWVDTVWQEFDLNGHRVGAPQMIVITKQSPNYTEPTSIRESLAIWNQAWFCSLRSAQGVYRYGKQTGNDELVRKALMTKELALQFPQEDGLFDAVIGTANVSVEIDGKTYMHGGSWKDYFLGNSNRNPVTRDLAKSPRHILDMSWTALHMLSWYEELEKDERLVEYVRRYVERLLALQDADGFFPAWIDSDGRILPELAQSPESAVSVTLLVQMHRLTGEERWLTAALRCMKVLVEKVMPDSRWEDFETYWSCSSFGAKDMLGKQYARNAAYKQCSLSPFYMAQALYECYQATKDNCWLEAGERCMDELLMFQSSFQPDYMAVTVVGGFGVMNGDAELNDARQSMFAELIIKYGKLLNRPEYVQRGYAALRASFSMMYCPENPIAKVQWEKKWPFLNEKDYGFMMENYGHDGYANDDSLGIGEFTIYDWGNGAASEAVMRIDAHFGGK